MSAIRIAPGELTTLTYAERNALASPPEGLLILNSSTGQLNLRQGGRWVAIYSEESRADFTDPDHSGIVWMI